MKIKARNTQQTAVLKSTELEANSKKKKCSQFIDRYKQIKLSIDREWFILALLFSCAPIEIISFYNEIFQNNFSNAMTYSNEWNCRILCLYIWHNKLFSSPDDKCDEVFFISSRLNETIRQYEQWTPNEHVFWCFFRVIYFEFHENFLLLTSTECNVFEQL